MEEETESSKRRQEKCVKQSWNRSLQCVGLGEGWRWGLDQEEMNQWALLNPGSENWKPCASKALPHLEEGLFTSAEAKSECELRNSESTWGPWKTGRMEELSESLLMSGEKPGSFPHSAPTMLAAWLNPPRRTLEGFSLRKRTTYMQKKREKLTLGSHPAKKADTLGDHLIKFYSLTIKYEQISRHLKKIFPCERGR